MKTLCFQSTIGIDNHSICWATWKKKEKKKKKTLCQLSESESTAVSFRVTSKTKANISSHSFLVSVLNGVGVSYFRDYKNFRKPQIVLNYSALASFSVIFSFLKIIFSCHFFVMWWRLWANCWKKKQLKDM